MEKLREGAEWQWGANKLTASSEYDERRRRSRRGRTIHGVHDAAPISGGAVYSAAQEVAEALGLSVAVRVGHVAGQGGGARRG